MKSLTFKIFCFVVFLPTLLFPCTTAIISGKATPDGRPLLWKHRDSGFEQNVIRYFNEQPFSYMGLVNAVDTLGQEVWAGVNDRGFAIMNSASYNLKAKDDTTRLKDKEGELMKLALRVCASLTDFENLLDSLPKPLGVESNFGVIDAQGGAAYYETNNFGYTKLDVNDPRIAPNGYLIHTNFSFTGRLNQGMGYIRFQMAEKLFNDALAQNNLTDSFILQKASRCLQHGLTGQDLTREDLDFVIFRDFIPRRSSVSVILVRGVKPGESPDHTLMWTILGFPLTSVSFPLWVANMRDLPQILKPGAKQTAPLCEASLQLKQQCFPIQRGSGKNYLHLKELWNNSGQGILQNILAFEKTILASTKAFEKELWSQKNPQKEIKKFYTKLTKKFILFYRQTFQLELEP
ncbi:MAG: hypothetical protein J7L94_04480 [Caldisericaceae bacterium]|nr:hypothetical protein [Caldisericaceae bacterium]